MTSASPTPLRFGIVGYGKMGKIRERILREDPRTVVTAVHDTDPQLDDASDLHVCRTLSELLRSDVDAVVVATPNRYTADLVCRALSAGKHVFCEKPPGRTVADVEQIRRAERGALGVKLKFGFNHRYHSGIREAKRIVDGGSFGPVLWMRGVYGKAGGEGFEDEWRSSREMCGGGILLDQGIHMLDLFRFFGGDFVEIKSMVTTAHWPIDVEDNAFALLRDSQGRVAMLHSSSTQWKHRFNLEIYMAKGFVSVNGILSSTRSYGDETITVARRDFSTESALGKPREETIYFDTDPSWELELDEFVRSILEDRAIESGTSADALEAMRMVYRIYGDDGSVWNPHQQHGAGEHVPSRDSIAASR
jgi:predicted dehydrogenase